MRTPIVMLFSAAATVAVADHKAIPFGFPAPVQALRPRMEYIKYLNDHNATETSYSKDPKSRVNFPAKRTEESYDDDEDEDEDEDTHTGFSLNFLNPLNLFKPEKRATRDCGIFKLDCAHARGVCNNACYYQNCVRAGETVRYQDFGGDKVANKENRVDAGTTVSTGTPCRNMPLSQRMYDSWPGWNDDDPNLQTDEWPMAAFKQPDFNDIVEGTVRNSLRCITYLDNGRGGREYKHFRRRISNYNPDTGKYADLRTCDTPKVFNGEETFTVEFDLSGMDDTEINEVVPYCKPNPDCTNDGRQFHLSTLRYVSDAGNAGQMGWPYDIETMNSYKLTGQDDPIESFQVVVKVTGDDRDIYAATVSKYRNGEIEEAGSANSDDLTTDQSLTVSGLPRALRVTLKDDAASGSRLDFVYGDPDNDDDKLASFSFNSNDFGFDNQFDNEDKFYCKITDLTDDDGDVNGQQYECWFPGW